jgi:hypothetical protein
VRERGADLGQLLEAPGHEDELVGPLAIEVDRGPLPGIPERLVGPTFLHLEEVEAERALGHLPLSVVVVDPLDEFLPGKRSDELDGRLHDSFLL